TPKTGPLLSRPPACAASAQPLCQSSPARHCSGARAATSLAYWAQAHPFLAACLAQPPVQEGCASVAATPTLARPVLRQFVPTQQLLPRAMELPGAANN